MSDHDWSQVLKFQDLYVQEDDLRQKQRRLRIKQIYKNQLQKMIQQHRYHEKGQKLMDKKFANQAYERQKKRIIQQQLQQIQKAKIKNKLANDNLQQIFIKRQKSQQNQQQQKKFYNLQFRRAQTEINEQNQMKIKIRQNQKKQLSNAYNSQIYLQRNKKKIQKLEDQKFVKLRQQIEIKKQRDRRYFFEKIKNNYRQNPEVYERSAAIITQHQKQRNGFVQKIVSLDTTAAQQELRQKKRQQKQKSIKQVSFFNKKYFQNKIQRDRYKSLQQIADYSMKYKTIQQQIQKERQYQSRYLQSKRNQLKNQLQRQIDQYHHRQRLKNKMNDSQYLLNKSGNIPALPGLSRDYRSEKQHKILENFLKGKSARKLNL